MHYRITIPCKSSKSCHTQCGAGGLGGHYGVLLLLAASFGSLVALSFVGGFAKTFGAFASILALGIFAIIRRVYTVILHGLLN